jgi:hypothetical protein
MAVFWEKRRRTEIAEVHRQPQGVDAFVRQAIEVFVRVVVDVVRKLVAIPRRTLDRPEEATRDAGADEWLSFHGAQRQERSLAATHLVFKVVDSRLGRIATGATSIAGLPPR